MFMNPYFKIAIPIFFVLTFFSCKKDSINVSKKEYKKNKSDGFWVFRTKKAITYNRKVAKPKRDRALTKINRENKHIEKQNGKQRQRYAENENFLKTFDHH